ncbi:hypothetical protein [Serratia sp. Se-RSBMAAmG]|uniref:hypothetical protein n=1 Tax=Serratia sp. Se-RSBMAAmG TaxID=3043305 RepID=UPI0024AF73C0|nr:hypothetical protein [Serratia sp. Se-RSBMAAmG]MDI6976612.1 hypothetical protein [Serratia sp. Se-RSBMAAmG]
MTAINEKVKQRLLKSDEEALILYDLIEASPLDRFYDNSIVGQDAYELSKNNEEVIFLAHQADNPLLIKHMWKKSEKELAIYFTKESQSKYLRKMCQNASLSKNPIDILSYSLFKIKNVLNESSFNKLKQELIFTLSELPIYDLINDLFNEKVITKNDLLIFSKINKSISGGMLAILNDNEEIVSLHTIGQVLNDIESAYKEDLYFQKRGVSINTQKKLSVLNTLLLMRSKSKQKENIQQEKYLLILDIAKYYQNDELIAEAQNNMFIDKFNFYIALTRENTNTKVKERI